MPKILPKDLTSYDFLKMAAVILMLVDHVGFHFYPEEMWFRAVGRLCVPVWFFLIGYARSRDIGLNMFGGAALLILSCFVAGIHIFPMNILVTMMAIRLTLDGIMIRALKSYQAFWGMALLLFFLSFPSALVAEYGTFGALFAMYGFIMRHRAGMNFKSWVIAAFIAALTLCFVLTQSLLMPTLSLSQFLFMLAGISCVTAGLQYFRPIEFRSLTAAVPDPLVRLIQLFGRRTLEIYVLHILGFRVVAMVVDPVRFSFWNWRWLPEGGVALFNL